MSDLTKKGNHTKYKILNYMFVHGDTSKAELARRLNLSMPTVLSNVNELVNRGIVEEKGKLESTGGRKARLLGLCSEYAYALGVNITARHLAVVLVNLRGEIVKWERIRLDFGTGEAYCNQFARYVTSFYQDITTADKILGLGIALPGIVDNERKLLNRSHALKLENHSLEMLSSVLPFPVYFENDANAAMLSENPELMKNAVYISLNNTLGGAICINGKLLAGERRKAGEFGHMLLVPGGSRCYCGKQGCADAYCAASVLTETDHGAITLEEFMQQVECDGYSRQKWETYLEYLAVMVSNLLMAFDGDIILGGDVGGYLSAYMEELKEKTAGYLLFEGDLSYLKNCSYKREAAAVGVAKYFFKDFMEQI